MKPNTTKYFLLVALLIKSFLFYSINDTLINKIDYSKRTTHHVNINLSGETTKLNNLELHWLYFENDSKDILSSNFNDQNFKVINRTELKQNNDDDSNEDAEFPKVNFHGVAWYKLYFKITTQFTKKIHSLNISQIGATEIYLDTILLENFGSITKMGLTEKSVFVNNQMVRYYIEDTLVHILTIRYGSPDYKNDYNFKTTSVGPEIILNGPEEDKLENNFQEIIYNITNMLAAFFFALFIIHLVIYLFYRDKAFNLLYSLFLLFLSLSFFEFYFVNFIESAETYLWVSNIDGIFFPACCFFLVTLLNKFLNVERSKHYLFFIFLMIALVIDILFIRKFTGMITTSIVFYTYFNTLAHSIQGIKQKNTSARFLGWGILSFTLSIILLIVSAIIISTSSKGGLDVAFEVLLICFLIVAILSIPLSMTAYLAYDFAYTNKSLNQQLVENQELNQQALANEKEKQDILKNQNKLLETQVEARTKEIGEQNKVLEHQKKEITDSITYAKRIQQALLPELEVIKKNLPNSFVFSLPKDIVSGDFYFFQTFNNSNEHPGRKQVDNENGVYIAAADCTGHGVPGALMSMIVHEKLENATKIYSEPKDILTSINKQVKDALKQSQNESASRDGCDIAFLKISGNKLWYAGAYRPLYIFDKEGVFQELKATKTAIAGLTPYDQEFNQIELDTNQLNAVYIFSDGFADQFGGQKSKKLTTKKFKELLHTIVKLPIDEQKAELERFFTSWKGNVEQIDDVLVIGITF